MPNRLSKESSPYLLQHAENPVDWYPWCDEALAKAAEKDKPIFLSIGYSACHWCHVMEHESFENADIAQFLNEHFVSIKVDREERPDLDQIYMQAVMALQGQGGWPLSVFLTPKQEVFFGGTYWPAESRMGMPGFDHVLRSVLNAYQSNRQQVDQQARQITTMLQAPLQPVEGEANIDLSLCDQAAEQLHNRFDSTYGGFGGAPKFPHTMDLSLLLQRAESLGNDQDAAETRQDSLAMVNTTLTKMAHGGIYDHLGGGFARYSVDARWLVPHFEKMLYDNALLANVYLSLSQVMTNPLFEIICRETLDYLRRDMTDPGGGFYSTEDADSEGVEGRFYVWTPEEIHEVLGEEDGNRFCQAYDVTVNGNFEGKNILNLRQPIDEFAEQQEMDPDELTELLQSARRKLLEKRAQRIRPGLDDKVIVSWNGLAIDAFAQAAIGLQNEDYLKTAQRAGHFIWSELRDDDGRLLHTWRKGVAKIPGYLDDYANLSNAYLTLFFADQNPAWIERAQQMVRVMLDHFWDDANGGFYFTADDQEKLIARSKEYQDSSVPSGNSMAAQILLRLGRLTSSSDLVDRAGATIRSALPLLQRAPLAGGQMLCVIDEWFRPPRELVLCLSEPADEALAAAVKRQLAPGTMPIIVQGADESQSLAWNGLLEGKTPVDGQPTLYVCSGYTCQSPIVGHEAVLRWSEEESGHRMQRP